MRGSRGGVRIPHPWKIKLINSHREITKKYALDPPWKIKLSFGPPPSWEKILDPRMYRVFSETYSKYTIGKENHTRGVRIPPYL